MLNLADYIRRIKRFIDAAPVKSTRTLNEDVAVSIRFVAEICEV